MENTSILRFRDKCFITGFLGDFVLQMIVKIRGNLSGLKEYFKRHQRFESMFIAGGMMYFFGYIYEIIGFEVNYGNLLIYGGLLDVIWRRLGLFNTLTNTYYAENTQFQSMIWGGSLPMILPLLLSDVFKIITKIKGK